MHDFVRQVDVGRRAFARDHEMNYPIPSFLGTCESREVSCACLPRVPLRCLGYDPLPLSLTAHGLLVARAQEDSDNPSDGAEHEAEEEARDPPALPAADDRADDAEHDVDQDGYRAE